MPDCSIVAKQWGELTTSELYSLLKLRTDVFLVEQKVDEEELDNRDQVAEHFFISDAIGTAAYLRVLYDESPEHLDAHRVIGRVVVRPDRRGEGLAQILLARVLSLYGSEAIMLHAQEYVAPLYAKAGFQAFGEPYDEAGIAHISMYRAAENENRQALPN
jgi:ElaA protein